MSQDTINFIAQHICDIETQTDTYNLLINL